MGVLYNPDGGEDGSIGNCFRILLLLSPHSPPVRVLEVEPDEDHGKDAADDAQRHHGYVQPDVDHAQGVLDDGPVLRHLVPQPDDLVLAVEDVGRRLDPREIVRLHVVERDDLVLSALHLFNFGPRDPVARVLVEGHRALQAEEDTRGY
jgi:hypothetical protein